MSTREVKTEPTGRAPAGGGEEDLLVRLRLAQCGSCSCMTKTPDPQYHAAHCATRVLQEAISEITTLRAKMAQSAHNERNLGVALGDSAAMEG